MKWRHVLLLLVADVLCLALYVQIANPAPMTGTISDKRHHPEYYPAWPSTPWVHVLCIESYDGSRCCTWTVSEDVYNKYNIGDNVYRGLY